MTSLYPTIVVGTDGSEPANEALRTAGELGRAVGTEKIHGVMANRRVERSEVLDTIEHLPED